jgi:hypothetical protein
MHTNNYPPIVPSDCQTDGVHKKQLYRVDSWEWGLMTNMRLLGTEVSLSMSLPNAEAGLGLFATRNFAEGELVGYLWGKFVTPAAWTAIQQRSIDPSFLSGEEDYVAPVKQGIMRVMEVPTQQNGASLLLASQQCPAAYINQGVDEETCNVQIVAPTDRFDSGCPVSSAYQYIEFRVHTQTGQGVNAGEEFQVDYGWDSKQLQQARQLYLAHIAHLRKARPGSLRGTYDLMRIGQSATTPTVRTSSVVSETSSSSDTSASHRKRSSLERVDRSYDGQSYYCCQKECFKHVPCSWITSTRSVKQHFLQA